MHTDQDASTDHDDSYESIADDRILDAGDDR